ncbi:biogenesis of lysosome-related organelles complex 1 subunit 6-like isoform X1 [Ostrea edulis]|uniref:biogenesis of lysosome-related organelles complex 1 subunit 6-like isoform X1 n=1 Tax=Ostrea edulis TaxID=37623 RepID=UPI0024AF6A6C|nr:biogenesis of lysosome-related organelles complex 1 subunit 6-like isoform X1 [Ostrea edulis]XP_056003202.1 biogenesis of lysosome-related organelles complex 1 subunit 6-like isoform X1 [Ostrea edulis]
MSDIAEKEESDIKENSDKDDNNEGNLEDNVTESKPAEKGVDGNPTVDPDLGGNSAADPNLNGNSTTDPDVDVHSTADPDVDEHSTADREEEEKSSIDPAVVEKLSLGLLEICLPSLQKSKSSLDDLLQNQQFLIETVQQENAKFTDCKDMEEIRQIMSQARRYQMKLLNLKKEMNALSDKSGKLKKRAVKLQQQKQKEDLQRVHQREREQEREKMLEAKVVKKSS